MAGRNRNIMFKDYRHLIYTVSRDGRCFIRIDRVIGDRVDFCTEIEIPSARSDDRWDIFDKLAENLGKTICIDSPSIRRELDRSRLINDHVWTGSPRQSIRRLAGEHRLELRAAGRLRRTADGH